MHVAVVGGGIFGQVIAWRLAVRGHEATVIEPVGPGHASSQSGDRSRIVRAVYDEPCFAEAGLEGLRGWAKFSAELGVRLVENVGVVYFDRQGDAPGSLRFRAWLDRALENMKKLGADATVLSPSEMHARWPAIAMTGVARAIWEPGAGFGRPALAARTIARASMASGRVKHVAAAARSVEVSSGVVRAVVVAPNGHAIAAAGETTTRIDADAVVVAAGLRGIELLRPQLGSDLGVRPIPHFASYWDVPYPEGAALHFSALPAWCDLAHDLYGFPDDGESGFKIAWHEPRRRSGEDAHGEADPDPSDLDELRRAAMLRFPALERATFRSAFPCTYDATPDEMFQIGLVSGVDRLVLVAGLSGHGFKHAPSLGESVVDLVIGDEPRLDLTPYALRTSGA